MDLNKSEPVDWKKVTTLNITFDTLYVKDEQKEGFIYIDDIFLTDALPYTFY